MNYSFDDFKKLYGIDDDFKGGSKTRDDEAINEDVFSSNELCDELEINFDDEFDIALGDKLDELNSKFDIVLGDKVDELNDELDIVLGDKVDELNDELDIVLDDNVGELNDELDIVLDDNVGELNDELDIVLDDNVGEPNSETISLDDELEKTMEISSFDFGEEEMEILGIKKPKKKKWWHLPITTSSDHHLEYAFVHCSVLAFITAAMGTGFLAYIINHI